MTTDTPTLPERIDFRRRESAYRHPWTGETRVARYLGRCVLCGIRTFGHDDGSDDPRGPLGDHAAAPLDPADYGATGATVPACFTCQNDTEDRYRRLIRRAARVGAWRYTEPDPVAEECFTCGAPVDLMPGRAYRGWRHLGPPTFHIPSPAEEAAARARGERPSYAPRPELADAHAPYPRRTAAPDCRDRAHHFSGTWCPICGGWG